MRFLKQIDEKTPYTEIRTVDTIDSLGAKNTHTEEKRRARKDESGVRFGATVEFPKRGVRWVRC